MRLGRAVVGVVMATVMVAMNAPVAAAAGVTARITGVRVAGSDLLIGVGLVNRSHKLLGIPLSDMTLLWNGSNGWFGSTKFLVSLVAQTSSADHLTKSALRVPAGTSVTIEYRLSINAQPGQLPTALRVKMRPNALSPIVLPVHVSVTVLAAVQSAQQSSGPGPSAGSGTGLTATMSGSQVQAGAPFAVSLMVQGDPSYAATDAVQVSLAEPDGGAELPSQASFSNGMATVDLTLTKAQGNTITISDQTLGLSAELPVTVGAGAATELTVSVPSQATVGTAFDVTLALMDSFNNVVPYSGTASLLMNLPGDSGAIVPDTATFVDGVSEVGVQPSTSGQESVVATVTAGTAIVSGQANLQVVGAAEQLVVPNRSLYAGGPIAATLDGATGKVSWRLVEEDNGYTFPLFGSTSATLNQNLERDIAQNTYDLVAEDLNTGTSYSQQVNVSSNYNPSVDTVTPSLVYNWQDMTPVYQTGVDGQGETIALYEQSGFNESDIQQFDTAFGLPNPQIEIYGPNGQTQSVDTSQNGAGLEAALDIEWAHAMAPLAKIVVYEQPPSDFGSNVDMVVQDANNRGFNSLSISFSVSADDPTGGVADQDILNASQNGLAIFVADGDHGSEVPGTTSWPSSNPNVVSVGGMEYDTNGTTYWNSGVDPNTGVLWAGGYGLTDYFAEPWQVSLGYGNYRIIPDVAFLANNAVSAFNGNLTYTGGTSLAAPCWAGVWALADQAYREQNGQGIPGQAAQVIYAVAADTHDDPAFFQQQGSTATFYEGIGFGSPDVTDFVLDVLKIY